MKELPQVKHASFYYADGKAITVKGVFAMAEEALSWVDYYTAACNFRMAGVRQIELDVLIKILELHFMKSIPDKAERFITQADRIERLRRIIYPNQQAKKKIAAEKRAKAKAKAKVKEASK